MTEKFRQRALVALLRKRELDNQLAHLNDTFSEAVLASPEKRSEYAISVIRTTMLKTYGILLDRGQLTLLNFDQEAYQRHHQSRVDLRAEGVEFRVEISWGSRADTTDFTYASKLSGRWHYIYSLYDVGFYIERQGHEKESKS